MKVSIITVCYNSAATIEKTMQSVTSQSWPDIEHIVVDGASKDQTLAIVNRYPERLRHIVSEPDKGVYDAMNKGLRLATGDVIAFLNADDTYKDSAVIESVARQMAEQQLDALYGDVEFFHAQSPARVVRTYDSSRFAPDRLSWGWMPAHPALFLRRSVYERVGLFDPGYRISGDFELVIRVFQSPGLRHRHCPRVMVRMQTGGLSTAGFAATIKLNREMMTACRANGLDTSWFKLMSRYVFKAQEYFR